MKFDKLVAKIVNEQNVQMSSAENKLAEFKQKAQINKLLTELEYASKEETKQSIEQALQGFDAELVQQARDARAQQKAMSKQGAAQGVAPIGIPPRSKSEERFRSIERNA
jgi:L-lactate utilization protein LutC